MPACPRCGRTFHDLDLPPGTRLRCACGFWQTLTTLSPPPDVAGTLHCPACGALAAAGDTVCRYCQAHLLTRFCPSCLHRNAAAAQHCAACGDLLTPEAVATPAAALACPRCRTTPLGEQRYRGQPIARCPRCGGLFVDHRVLHELLRQWTEPAALASTASTPPRPAREPRVAYLACPLCAERMQRRAAGGGVIVDVCPPHGVWFDADEFAWVRARSRPPPAPTSPAAACAEAVLATAPPPVEPPAPGEPAVDAALIAALIAQLAARAAPDEPPEARPGPKSG